MDCIFCKIIEHQVPAKILYEDEKVIAFYDLDPQAPLHVLIIPKQHIQSVDAIMTEHQSLIGHIFRVASQIAKQLGAENGYRIVTNCGSDGGQSVNHLHFHLLGGRQMAWPPG